MARGVWREADATLDWDTELARLGGHPLQSLLWGSARREVDGISQLLLACRSEGGEALGLARVERRRLPLVGDVAWLPRGPALAEGGAEEMLASLGEALRRHGFLACITDRYVVSGSPGARQPRTLWLDLGAGLESLSGALDAQWRYGVRRAAREGVRVRATAAPSEVAAFYRMCSALSAAKGFALPGSEALMQALVAAGGRGDAVGATLHVGEVGGEIAGGALVARCGRHLHYLWGASDRRFSRHRVSEAVQWRVIEEGVAAGMIRYDLEGIDPAGNPGVYDFKRKMGGREIVLEGMRARPLTWVGQMVCRLGRATGRLQ